MKSLTILFVLINTALFAQLHNDNKGLKDYYQGYFPIGVAVSAGQLKDPEQATLILKNFNSLTPENAMKMGPIHPEENRYFWGDADSIIAFAQKHNLKVRGHNLCWYKQTPRWIFYNNDGKLVTKNVLLQRLKDHVYNVVGRYKGKIYAWDVVNEAVADESTQFLRNSLWYQICGEDFIYKAFQYAHEADPDAILFYNDYNTEQPEKRQRIYRLLKKMIDTGVPVNAIGFQAHWSINDPTGQELKNTIELFSSLGLKVQITELDISIYADNDYNVSDLGFTPARQQGQADQYAKVFKIFRDYKQTLTGVTFWNLSDRYSWLDNFPIRGRKNYPLLFDEQLQPKKAYWDVVTF